MITRARKLAKPIKIGQNWSRVRHHGQRTGSSQSQSEYYLLIPAEELHKAAMKPVQELTFCQLFCCSYPYKLTFYINHNSGKRKHWMGNQRNLTIYSTEAIEIQDKSKLTFEIILLPSLSKMRMAFTV